VLITQENASKSITFVSSVELSCSFGWRRRTGASGLDWDFPNDSSGSGKSLQILWTDFASLTFYVGQCSTTV